MLFVDSYLIYSNLHNSGHYVVNLQERFMFGKVKCFYFIYSYFMKCLLDAQILVKYVNQRIVKTISMTYLEL